MVIRQSNILGQQRVDVPHIRALESSAAGDFDVLAGTMLGGREPLILTGFKLIYQGVTDATQLLLNVQGGTMIHFNATEAGSIFQVAPDRTTERLDATNPRVVGQFAPNQVNYVGIDLVRVADAETADVTMFLDPTTLEETPKTVPLARTLDYRIVISTLDFSSTPGICPIAKIKTDGSNAIDTIQDARDLMFRLAPGGAVPDPLGSYSWPGGRREFSQANEDLFAGGDKAIGSLKAWMDAVMTRVWEIGGGEHWYSPTSDRNLRMVHAGTPFSSNGEFFEWNGTHLHWKGLRVLFDNSLGRVNEVYDQTTNVVGLTDLLDGECLYVDLDRTQDRTGGTALRAKKAQLQTLGAGSPPGSRCVLAWRLGSQIFTRDQGYSVGASFKTATIGAAGAARITADDAATPGLARAVAYDSTSQRGIAGGLSRGDTGSDYIDGAGDIEVGGLNNDHDVKLHGNGNNHAVVSDGTQQYSANQRSAHEVENNDDFSVSGHKDNRTLTLRGKNGSSKQDAHGFEAAGALGWRITPTTPETPAPTTASPIRVKTFFQTNGEPSPSTRDQFCIMWHDGSITVIAEGPSY